MSLLQDLQWRYATKRFDPTKRVDAQTLQNLKEAVNLSASSYGLQPYRVMIVEDEETKEKLRAAAFNQAQLTEASHIFVICHMLAMPDEYIDGYIARIADVRDLPVEKVKGYGDYMKGAIGQKPADEITEWNRRQAYIGLGNLLAACAEFRVDSCPMEGFEAAKVSDILGLEAMGLAPALIAPVGYRSEEDVTQHHEKVRLPVNDMFISTEAPAYSPA